MKTTIKLILVITLFLSTSSIALADGDQTNSGICTVNCSEPTDPGDGSGNSFDGGTFEPTNLTTTNDESLDLSENNETFSLMNWFLSFLG